MLGIALADDAGHALTLDDFAVLADRLDARTNLHWGLRGRLRTSCPIYRGPRSHARRASYRANRRLSATMPSPRSLQLRMGGKPAPKGAGSRAPPQVMLRP